MGIFILKMRPNCHKSGSRFKVVRMVPVVRRVVTCCLKNAEIKRIVKLVKQAIFRAHTQLDTAKEGLLQAGFAP